MFYDHRILTEAKYGIATVWLVATLGNKSSVSKKVQKREILDVDLNKACDTILNPEAPLALRLQSNLLYGVSRVYKEQYHYFYSDVNTAHTKLSKEVLTMTLEKINMRKERSRPENLLMQDDPAFVPGLALLANTQDLDGLFGVGDTSASTIGDESLGPVTPASKVSPQGKYQLDTLSSLSGGGGFDIMDFGNDEISFHGSGLEQDLGFPEEVDFEFTEDGNIREIEPVKRGIRSRASQMGEDDDYGGERKKARRASSIDRAFDDDLAQQMVLDDHDGGLKAVGNNFDFDIPNFDNPNRDVDFLLPQNASPLPERQQQAPADHDDVPMVLDEPDEVPRQQQPKKRGRRQGTKTKNKLLDEVTLIPQRTLAEWQMNYAQIMAAEKAKKEQSTKKKEAKANSRALVFEIKGLPAPLSGMNEILLGLLKQKHPSMDKKKDADAPVDMPMADDYDPQIYNEDEMEIGLRANADDKIPNILQETSPPEVGRKGSVPLSDSAAAMPWNMSQGSRGGSVFSAAGGAPTSSVGGNVLSSNRKDFSKLRLTRYGSRQGTPLGLSRVSASPLHGRGVQQDGEDVVMEGWDITLSSPRAEENLEGLNNFEYYGRAAGVETQEAQGTQWVLDALEEEGKNFLGYIQTKLEEMQAVGDDNLDLRGESDKREINFGTLVDPNENSSIVAAQAFHHTLSLATKGLLKLKQEEPYGDIAIQVLAYLE